MSIWQKLKSLVFAKPQTKIVTGKITPPSSTKNFKEPPLFEPPWVKELNRMVGLHESTDKAKISKWLASDGKKLGDPEKLPWCGDAVDTALNLTLPNEGRTPDLKANPYWALNWLQFGYPSKAVYGAILVFKRPSGGHVGFAVGQNVTHYEVLGGNQSNSVSRTFIEKSRCVGIRWPKTYTGEKLPLPNVILGRVSKNEA